MNFVPSYSVKCPTSSFYLGEDLNGSIHQFHLPPLVRSSFRKMRLFVLEESSVDMVPIVIFLLAGRSMSFWSRALRRRWLGRVRIYLSRFRVVY